MTGHEIARQNAVLTFYLMTPEGISAPDHVPGPSTLTVVVPTFNEAQNIGSLIHELEGVLCGIHYHILIVDDDSPDLTWKCAEAISQTHPRISALRRTANRGLTPAVIEGFAHAETEVVACIDGDLQHDPSILPKMLHEIESGADLVVASRHLDDGGVGDWPWSRQLVSWGAAKLARVCIGAKLSDPTSGYFMMRRKVFLTVPSQLEGSGFKILLEILGNARLTTIREVGYVFRKRHAGKSKLSGHVIFSYLTQLWRLSPLGRLVSPVFLQFGAVGALGIVVNLVALAGIVGLSGIRDWRASATATLIATIHNYILNNRWTFRDRPHTGWRRMSGYISYLAVCLVGLGLTTLAYFASTASIVRMFGPHNSILPVPMILVCQSVAIAVATGFNYSLCKRLIWRRARAHTEGEYVAAISLLDTKI